LRGGWAGPEASVTKAEVVEAGRRRQRWGCRKKDSRSGCEESPVI
jgi:hypothetical protein